MEIDWTDDKELLKAATAQLAIGLGGLAASHGEADLMNGFVSGRYAFVVSADGVVLLERPEV